MADLARIAKHHCNKQLEGKLEYILFFIFFFLICTAVASIANSVLASSSVDFFSYDDPRHDRRTIYAYLIEDGKYKELVHEVHDAAALMTDVAWIPELHKPSMMPDDFHLSKERRYTTATARSISSCKTWI